MPRLAVVTGLTVAATLVTWTFWSTPRPRQASDFMQVWAGARTFVGGGNPYTVVGPGRQYEFAFQGLYPFTAMVAALPLSRLPIRIADPLFVAIGTAFLAIVLTRRTVDNPQLLAFVSLPFWFFLQTSQWSPLLTGAALVPAAGWLLACKPNIGLALFAAFPSWRGLLGMASLGLLSVLLWPHWIFEWVRLLPTAAHVIAPVRLIAGPLILLALLKWRRAEARLLVALGCIPHTTAPYEALPLFLVVQHWEEGIAIWALSFVAFAAQKSFTYPSYEADVQAFGQWTVWCMYLPCTLMVLRRPNVWTGIRLGFMTDHRTSRDG